MATKTMTASKALQLVQLLTEELDRDAPIAQLLTFLTVARAGAGGIEQSTIQKELKLSTAAMSRTVQALSAISYQKDRPGFGLVERVINPADNRFRSIKLTPKGEKLVAKLEGM